MQIFILILDLRIATNANPRFEIKSKSILNSFKAIMTHLKKLKLPLNFFEFVFKQKLNPFELAHFDQNSTNYQNFYPILI